MNGDVMNGAVDHRPNGLPAKPATSHPGGEVLEPNLQNGIHHHEAQSQPNVMANGVVKNGLSEAAATKLLNGLHELPPEIEEVSREYFVGLGKLIGHSAQDSWNSLSSVVDELSNSYIRPQPQPTIPGSNNVAVKTSGPVPNNTKENLDKKEALLDFAKEQKDVFIKLLVLLHWSKDVEDVSKVIDLNRWLRDRISRYGEVATDIARMKRYLAFIQIPNPDLKTAAEVLSGQTVTGFTDLGYIPPKPITDKQALKTLKALNSLLCTRLTLHEDVPPQLQNYRIHDGRVTFFVQDEFELDLSVLNENFESQFCLADFRFAFSPSADFPAGGTFDELAFAANDVLGKTGLLGCYEFLHEFTLSYKINVLFKQALELLQGQWSDNLRIEMIHRTLVVQYWTNRHGPKSWIEIGLKSGRKRKAGQLDSSKNISIGVRWMQAGKEVEDAGIIPDLHHLSMEALLRQVIARHINHMFDTVFDSLSTIPLYQEGDLQLNQSASSTDPSNCSIELELAKGRTLKVALQTVTGAIVMTPTSGLCNQVEADLNRAPNMVEELPRRLSYLRVKTAEEDLTSQAEATGWVILRSFVPSAAEKAKWFSPLVQRSMFLRCPHWEAGHMLAATHSPQGDGWWLLTQENTDTWTSQSLRIESRHKERQITQAYMRSLQDYCSGVIVLQQNARHLNTIGIQCALGVMPPIGTTFHFPHITLDFQPAELDAILKPQSLSTDWEYDQFNLSSGEEQSPQSHIREVVTISYLGQSLSTGATLKLSGFTRHGFVDERILTYLRQTINNFGAVTFRQDEEKFSIRVTTAIGKPAIEELLRHLLRLETIIACVKGVQNSPSSAVTSLSLDHIAMCYRSDAAAKLGIDIKFRSSNKPLSIEFTPKDGNPHELIRLPLLQMLSQSRQSLSSSLVSILPLLSSTFPLMSLFRELQTEKWYEAIGQHVEPVSGRLLPRIHIMARHTTMFGIQLYAPAGFNAPSPSGPHHATGMLVRFEMLPLTRRGRTKWLLRPAIEEFDSYVQPSYCCVPLKERLEQEIFKATEPKGWQAIDSWAACELNEPKPLLQAVLGVVIAWMNDYSANQIGDELQAQPVAQTENPPAAKATPAQLPKAQKAKSSANVNMRGGSSKGPSKGPQEVITLD